MEAIDKLPPGTVTAKVVLVREDYRLELLRIRYGGRTRFVERVTRTSRDNIETIQSFRQTDEYLKEDSANAWFEEYVELKIKNEQYKQTERSEHNG